MGYVGSKMSERAVIAYSFGEKPMSKWTKADIIEGVVAYGVWSREVLESYKRCVLADYFLYNSSWHHTGRCYNETNFYCIDEDRAEHVDMEALNLYAFEAQEKNAQSSFWAGKPEIKRAYIEYEEWEGSRRYGKFVKHEKHCLVVGDWAYTLDGKKNINGEHIKQIQYFERTPKGTADTYKRIKNMLPKSLR